MENKERKGERIMKELKEAIVNLENYDINVKQYLTYAQIQKIIETTMKYQTWAERESNIDFMVLCYTTDLTPEKIDEIGFDNLVTSGLVEDVIRHVSNYYDIMQGLNYHESVGKALTELSKNLPQIKEMITNELHK